MAGLAAVVAGLVVALGAWASWVAGPDADEVFTGVVVDPDGVGIVGSRAGLDGGDGLVLLLAAALLVVCGVVTAVRGPRSGVTAVMAAAVAVGAMWWFLTLTEIGSTTGDDGTDLELTAGPGVWVAAIGLALGVAAIVAQAWARPVQRAPV